jgi:hypothetical protein
MIRTLNNSSPEAKNFLKFIRDDLRNNRVALKFSKSRDVRFDGITTTAAYFQEPCLKRQGIIRIGTGNRKPVNVLTNLIHEYCHFLQWKNGDAIWKRLRGDAIDGESYVTLEEHTERDSLRLIREWHLPVNHSAIRKRSRAYIAYLRQESK